MSSRNRIPPMKVPDVLKRDNESMRFFDALTRAVYLIWRDIGGENGGQIPDDVLGNIDHGSISGLGDDDHAQYHNDSRGDARYRFSPLTITSNTTLSASPQVVLCNSSSNITVTLPAVSSATQIIFYVKKISNSGIVTIDANGSQLIDNSETVIISSQYDSVTLYCDGSKWWIL